MAVSGRVKIPGQQSLYIDESAGLGETTGARFSGTIKWFNRRKGTGFIAPAAGGADVFFHQKNTLHVTMTMLSLDEGDAVEYELGWHKETPTALRVTLPGGRKVHRIQQGRRAEGAAAAKEGGKAAAARGGGKEAARGSGKAAAAAGPALPVDVDSVLDFPAL